MKSLDEQINELEVKIEAEPEVKTEEIEEAEEVKEELEEKIEEAKETVEEVKEVKEEKKPEVDAGTAYQLREAKRILAEENAKRTALEAELAELKKPKTEADPQPNREEDPIAYLEWELRNTKKTASELNEWKKQVEQQQEVFKKQQAQVNAFTADSQQATTQIPDLEAGIDHMYDAIKKAVRVANPMVTETQADQYARNQMMGWADQYANQGLNRAQALYLLSKQNYGYEMKQPEPEVIKPVKTSLETIEKNKSKSASGLGTGSTKSNVITADWFKTASVSDIEANKDELMAAGLL